MQRRDDHKRSATMCDVFEKAQLTGLRNPSRKRSTRGFGGDFQNRVRRQGKSLGNVHFSKGGNETDDMRRVGELPRKSTPVSGNRNFTKSRDEKVDAVNERIARPESTLCCRFLWGKRHIF